MDPKRQHILPIIIIINIYVKGHACLHFSESSQKRIVTRKQRKGEETRHFVVQSSINVL